MRLIQHKREAYWFYRFLSPLYDRWVNPLFWTPEMRTAALRIARLDRRSLDTIDVGAGTGFTTEGIVEHVDPAHVTMIDQSPHQLARAEAKPALAACRRLLGDAEELPFPTDHFDRYVSAGSIEYWPDPQRGIAEAYRVLRPGGLALVIGPLPPANPVARWLATTWMLFPREDQYRDWFEAAGFVELATTYVRPSWHRGSDSRYGLAIAGVKPGAGMSPLGAGGAAEQLDGEIGWLDRLRTAARFVAGSAAGAVFVPIAAVLAARERIRRRR